MASTKVTRADLYEQVWTTPMSRLASSYGVSDVALAKTCRKLGVPTPGRGYWARLASGEKLKRPALPRVRGGQPEGVFVERPERSTSGAPKEPPPVVVVPEDLAGAHEAVRALTAALENAATDRHERLVLAEPWGREVFAVSVAAHRRALLLLEGLIRAQRDRGHATGAAFEMKASEHGTIPVLALSAYGELVDISIVERLDRREHVLSPSERARVAKGHRYQIPKYDHFPCGRLRISVGGPGRLGRAWSDTTRHPLDGSLGQIVLAVEAAAKEQKAKREGEQRLIRSEEQRRREKREAEARARHADALEKDLHQMVQAWSQAENLRHFLAAVEGGVPVALRDGIFDRWIAWARDFAEAVDPLRHPERIAKDLDVSVPDGGGP